jgi:hypothetical protein
MKSISPFALALVCAAFAAPASADVTLKQKTGGKGIGVAASGESTQYLKGMKFRTDQTVGGKMITTIMDPAAKLMVSINHEKKEADVYDIAKLGESMSKIPITDVKASVSPTTITRQIAGATCTVHDVKVEVPMNMGNMPLTIVTSGPQCLVKNGPGHADFAAFYRAAAESGMMFGDPRQAKAQPGMAKGVLEMYRKMAELGVPYALEMNIAFAGEGPMAAMMGKMGNQSMTSEVVSVSTDALADSLFEIPAGYKVNKR